MYKNSNYNDLVEDTSLQKLLKQQLLKNKRNENRLGKIEDIILYIKKY